MLTQTLRNLERDGLISRTVTATVPVTVSYELTALCLSLYETVRQLKLWAEDIWERCSRTEPPARRRPAGLCELARHKENWRSRTCVQCCA